MFQPAKGAPQEGRHHTWWERNAQAEEDCDCNLHLGHDNTSRQSSLWRMLLWTGILDSSLTYKSLSVVGKLVNIFL